MGLLIPLGSVTLSSLNSNIKVGDSVTGTNISASTTISSINGNTLTLNRANTYK